jgi:hypothetical protein
MDYIGDGVYVEEEDGMMVLTTVPGAEPGTGQTIYLEPSVWVNLIEWRLKTIC